MSLHKKRFTFRKAIKVAAVAFVAIVLLYCIFLSSLYPPAVLWGSLSTGRKTDGHNGVAVYNNGPDFPRSHGKHYTSDSSYYFGKKWQCVEFMKRYYFVALNHRMPDGYGHAKDFFDKKVAHGKLNKARNLLQFYNGGNVKPRADDILVFDGQYGHVAIVTKVDDEWLEIIQQNIFMQPRRKLKLTVAGGKYSVGEDRKPLGWLRKMSERTTGQE